MINRDSNFKNELLRLYKLAREHQYKYMLHPDEVDELMYLYMEEYLTPEKVEHLDEEEMIRLLMTQMTAVYRLDPGDVGRDAENIVLINNVKYDGENLYIQFKKIPPVKMRRFEIGMSMKELSKQTGYSEETVVRCESQFCDMSKQPESLQNKFAEVLKCTPEDIYWPK